MKVVYVADGPVLLEGAAPELQPGQGEIAIRVCAAGVILTELQWESTTRNKEGQPRQRAIPGHEFSGVITAIGPGVSGWSLGQEVFGMSDWYRDGALAEFCLTEPSAVAKKPGDLTHVEAASVPISALTAWQGLFERACLQPGERVLVHGGAGSVGTFAVQIAKWAGASVVTTAAARNTKLAEQLGAEQIVNYEKTRFEEAGKFDIVFDVIGGEILERSWSVLKQGGRMVTVATPSANGIEQRVKDAFFIVSPDGKRLGEIGELLRAGTLRTYVDAVFPLSQAPDVYSERVVRKRQGKLVISIADC